MGKKKSRKDDKKKKFEYSTGLYGVVLIILAIMAFGPGKPLGYIGKLARSFAIFLFGTLDWLFIAAVFCVGVYMLFKGKSPSFWSTKFIGLLIVMIGVLVFAHLNYVIENSGNAKIIFKETVDDIMATTESIKNGVPFTTYGSGIIGCALAVAFNILFDYTGTKIVAIILMITGTCFFTGFSIVDFVQNSIEKSKSIIKKKEKNSDSKDKDEEEKKSPVVIINDNNAPKEDTDSAEPKLVISSIDELKRMNNEVREEKEEENKPVEVVENVQTAFKSNYILPTLSLLKPPERKKSLNNQAVIEKNIMILEKTLRDFGIIGKVVEVNSGPSVTQYEMEIQTGTKLSKLLSINRELSLALAKKDIRIEAPIPGKSTVGIEIPNETVAMVSLREILENVPQNKVGNKLLVALGKNIMGKSLFAEIDKTPHLLVAGATGSGKSVCINCIIASILMRAKPDEVKLVLVDPKKVELSVYNGIPHLLMPVVTDPKKANVALQKMVDEMERRYDELEEKNVRNIKGYNEWVDKENQVRSEDDKIAKMPYIVVIVDELADLMMVAGKEVEDSIMRITQKARAAGIHLIVATQRPSTDVITGVVKANIPSRISFAVSSGIDSRTILDQTGAEKLLGKGDMLFLPMGESSPERIQGAYVSDEEIESLVAYTVEQQKAQYDEKFMNLNAAKDMGNAGSGVHETEEEYDDPLYDEIVEFVITSGKASASLLQRRFKLGYNRAARIVDLLEERGIIGPQNGSKPREVLVKIDNSENMDNN